MHFRLMAFSTYDWFIGMEARHKLGASVFIYKCSLPCDLKDYTLWLASFVSRKEGEGGFL